MADTIPHVCPCCGQPTRIHESSGKGEKGEDRIIKTLYCDNPDCETRRLKKFVHFVSQKAMDIEGLSEATLENSLVRDLSIVIWTFTVWTATGLKSSAWMGLVKSPGSAFGTLSSRAGIPPLNGI